MKSIDILLIGGQSNAVGCTFVSTLDENLRNFVAPNVLLYQEGNFAPVFQSKLIKGIQCGMGHCPEQMGIEYGMAHRLHEATAREIGFIRYAYGGTTLFSHWQANYESEPKALTDTGYCYHNFLQTVRNGLQVYRENGYEPTIKGMVWMQGETDANTQETATVYEANMKNLFTRFRKDLGLPTLKIIVGEIATQKDHAPYSDEIRAIQRRVSNADEYCVFLSTKDIPVGKDGYHFDGNEDFILGKRFAEYALEYLEIAL